MFQNQMQAATPKIFITFTSILILRVYE